MTLSDIHYPITDVQADFEIILKRKEIISTDDRRTDGQQKVFFSKKKLLKTAETAPLDVQQCNNEINDSGGVQQNVYKKCDTCIEQQ